MNVFNPIYFIDIWMEYNILEVVLALLTSNYSTGTDLNCQCDMITVCVNLLAGISL